MRTSIERTHAGSPHVQEWDGCGGDVGDVGCGEMMASAGMCGDVRGHAGSCETVRGVWVKAGGLWVDVGGCGWMFETLTVPLC